MFRNYIWREIGRERARGALYLIMAAVLFERCASKTKNIFRINLSETLFSSVGKPAKPRFPIQKTLFSVIVLIADGDCSENIISISDTLRTDGSFPKTIVNCLFVF